MNKYKFVTAVIILSLIVFWLTGRNTGNGNNGLLNPMGKNTQSVSPRPTFIPNSIPKTFKFENSTNLKAELEKVNPQVLDSDFE